MGLVGNFAAQLFRLAGAEVIATDLSELRRQKARACGIDNVVNPDQQDLREAVMEWTGGKGVGIAVEAIGLSEVIHQTVMLTQRFGEFILLGNPRARAVFDATPMLLQIHIEPSA